MENTPCYLCSVYKGTWTTKDGLSICSRCKDDLHEEANKGDEFVKDEEKTPTLVGSKEKIEYNEKEIGTFKGISYETEHQLCVGCDMCDEYPPTGLSHRNPFDQKTMTVKVDNSDDEDDEDCCSDPGYCDCESGWSDLATTNAIVWPYIEPDMSDIAQAVRDVAQRLEKDLFQAYSIPALYVYSGIMDRTPFTTTDLPPFETTDFLQISLHNQLPATGSDLSNKDIPYLGYEPQIIPNDWAFWSKESGIITNSKRIDFPRSLVGGGTISSFSIADENGKILFVGPLDNSVYIANATQLTFDPGQLQVLCS